VCCVALSLSGAINSAPRRLISSLKCSYFAALVAPNFSQSMGTGERKSRVMKPGLSAVAVRMSLGRVFILNLMDQLDRNLIFKYRCVHPTSQWYERKTNAEQLQQRIDLVHLRKIYSSISGNWLFVPLFSFQVALINVSVINWTCITTHTNK
jgi:hypothetical protein